MKRKHWTILFCLLVTYSAHGFGPTGHRTVAEIADHYLTPKARMAVYEILEREPMASAATWPDDMRSATQPSSTFWTNAADWHFVNTAQGQQYKRKNPPPSCPAHLSSFKEFEEDVGNYKADAYEAIECFASILQSTKAIKPVKQFALKFVIHLAGDLHQPLHLGYAKDYGGNSITLKYFGKTVKLHGLWDSSVIDNQQLSFTELAMFLETADQARINVIASSDPYDWLQESFRPREVNPLVVDGVTLSLREEFYERIQTCKRISVYADDGDKSQEGTISNCAYDFSFNAVPMINMQLQKGGIRLATYLNKIFDPISNGKVSASR